MIRLLKTAGIHHMTAMVNDAQRNIDFYTGVLGLRLVKKTVNFDRPEVYHLYFGNETGHPGTVITFFPWEKQLKGRIGTGQVGVTSYMVPIGSIEFWKDRLDQFGIDYRSSFRFGGKYLTFSDPDGLQIELAEQNEGLKNHWNAGGILPDYAITGFSGATLISIQPHKTADVLENILGLQCLGDEDGFLRFKSDAQLGNTIDIKLTPSVRGLMGSGTVHHIAWRASDLDELERWKLFLQEREYYPTEVLNRNYFQSIYFHEKGGILFEIATDQPGFTVDEPINRLGEKLMLPSWLESKRVELEETLPNVGVHNMGDDKR